MKAGHSSFVRVHCTEYRTTHHFWCNKEVMFRKVSVVCFGFMLSVSKQLGGQREILRDHNGLTGNRVSTISSKT